MPPREARPRVKGAFARGREPSFRERAYRVLSTVRALRVKQRPIYQEFDVRPDPEAFPLYYQLVAEPCFLADIDDALRRGEVASCDQLASKFKLMIRNAKSFNKPGSTIYKDASRLYNAFRDAMLEEFRFQVDEYEEDEEDLWVQDLAQRPRLAAEERAAYREVLAQWERSSAHSSRRSKGEKHLKPFVSEPLNIVTAADRPSKNELARAEFMEETARLRPASMRPSPCDAEECVVCGGTAGTRVSAVKVPCEVVFIPQFRLIAAPEAASASSRANSRKRNQMSPSAPQEPRKLEPPIERRRFSESSSSNLAKRTSLKSSTGKVESEDDVDDDDDDDAILSSAASLRKRVKRTPAPTSNNKPMTRHHRNGAARAV